LFGRARPLWSELNALAGHHIQADRQWSGFFCRSNAGPMRREASALLLCSVDCFPLGFEGEEDMIRMVFDHVILDVAAFGPPLGQASMYTLDMRLL
jgi:hypothetical protein